MKHTPQQFVAWTLVGLAFVLAAAPVKAQYNGGEGSAWDSQSQSMWPGSKVSTHDRNFLVQAAADEMFELQMSRLAAERASAPDLKAYAARLVDQHLSVQQELGALAQAKGVALPTRIGALRQRELYSLERLSGEDFDRAYFQRIATRAHRQDVRLYQNASRMAQDTEIREWANKMMPAQEQHVSDARALPSARRLALTPFDPNAQPGGM